VRRFRILLSVFVALAVGLAPVGVALASQRISSGHEMHGHNASPHAMADCHGKIGTAKKLTKDCPCCDTKAKCPGEGCGMTCCKLLGMLAASLHLLNVAAAIEPQADPHIPPDWSLRPQPPPPRS
jgi:hypothetical protein